MNWIIQHKKASLAIAGTITVLFGIVWLNSFNPVTLICIGASMILVAAIWALGEIG